ncbi:short chain dehydrogenase [Aquincola sp. J276]|uniref:short chain dehydrogenase n=1 Tax=Aquincola sp. J276 TaxID=2898432 RepID=UPI0021509BC0|nr:short chain dehydrogenase [Aquincola sp. J276]MCR5865329.1 short chain dehydrogenase [Aquincola sp. J276]
MKKILIVGASGAVGSAVAEALSGSGHQILRAGRSSGDFQVDITREASVQALFEATGPLDAIVSAAGSLHFGPLAEMRAADFDIGLQDKLLGQVRLALLGQHVLRDGGSITLTSGILAEEPVRQGANASAVNAGIHGFVIAAAVELGRGLRINAVSPTVLEESMGAYGAFFPGFIPAPARKVAQAYRRSVEGVQTGRVYAVHG